MFKHFFFLWKSWQLIVTSLRSIYEVKLSAHCENYKKNNYYLLWLYRLHLLDAILYKNKLVGKVSVSQSLSSFQFCCILLVKNYQLKLIIIFTQEREYTKEM